MAVAILSLRNGILRQLVVDPGLDLDTYGRELVALVELATRKDKILTRIRNEIQVTCF